MLIIVSGKDRVLVSNLELRIEKIIEELDNNLIHTGNEYLVLKVKSILKIQRLKIVEGYLKVYVNYEALAVKFFKDELVVGKIISQDENGLRVECPFLKYAFIHHSDFLENSKFIKSKQELWSWWYRNNVYYLKNGDEIRYKVKTVDYENRYLHGRINEMGLGPKRWWL